MTQKTQAIEEQIAAKREEIADAQAEAERLRAELDEVPARIREAHEQGKRATVEAQQRGASRAEAYDLRYGPVEKVRREEKMLTQEHREAQVRIADVECELAALERGAATRALRASGISQREEQARRKLEEAQAELEALRREKVALEGRVHTAHRAQIRAQRRARQVASGEADRPGFIQGIG